MYALNIHVCKNNTLVYSDVNEFNGNTTNKSKRTIRSRSIIILCLIFDNIIS